MYGPSVLQLGQGNQAIAIAMVRIQDVEHWFTVLNSPLKHYMLVARQASCNAWPESTQLAGSMPSFHDVHVENVVECRDPGVGVHRPKL